MVCVVPWTLGPAQLLPTLPQPWMPGNPQTSPKCVWSHSTESHHRPKGAWLARSHPLVTTDTLGPISNTFGAQETPFCIIIGGISQISPCPKPVPCGWAGARRWLWGCHTGHPAARSCDPPQTGRTGKVQVVLLPQATSITAPAPLQDH